MSEAKYHSKLPMMAGKGNIRVVLVDSDQEWGRRFTEFLKTATDIHLINISVTKEEAVRAGLQLDVDVVVVNTTLRSPGYDGLDASKEILAKKDIPIIVVASSNDPEVVVEAMAVGAVNFICKAYMRDIIIAIREAYHRNPSLHPRASKVLREEVTRLKRQEFCCKLTTTEKEVLQLIALGYSQSKTIQLMGISPNTMKTHVRHISRKLGTKSIKEAAIKARRFGLEKQ
ncbi:Transcriptional regulatory protein LiaR [Paenibacillus konkukensis]|uniref:Transcriptional regulatory protein LiaR n=1 Tax=Paenibacillus konkukensis TaxID=2020716 RepID=A0ABY4RTR4_9BACL|nr:response regulator transcription factor [Paenibacillus konkukensis]UQZ85382.1 Transcriptional regulatory protein LiaR [Paenibacillus konkukensis]